MPMQGNFKIVWDALYTSPEEFPGERRHVRAEAALREIGRELDTEIRRVDFLEEEVFRLEEERDFWRRESDRLADRVLVSEEGSV